MKTIAVQFTSYFKTILREPSIVIWSILWPILLTVFYIVAFSGIGQSTLDSFTIAIHRNNNMATVFTGIEFIDTTLVDEDQAGLDLLYPQADDASRDGSVDEASETMRRKPIAYLDEENVLHYPSEKANNTELTILRSITDSIASSRPLIQDAIRDGVSPLQINKLIDFEQPIKNKTVIGEMAPMTLPYLAIFGMVTLMGSFATQDFVRLIQADQSTIAVRQAISPVRKSRLILMAILSSFIFILISGVLLIFFMHFAAGIDLLSHVWTNLFLLALPILGNLALGIWIGTLPLNSSIKPGICMAFMLGFASLAGLMTPDIVYMLRENMPILLDLNPVYRLSQALIRVNILGYDPQLGSYGLYFLIYTLIFVGASSFILSRRQFKSFARN